jgi:hypothetical protein
VSVLSRDLLKIDESIVSSNNGKLEVARIWPN